jgi:hypothetical protein
VARVRASLVLLVLVAAACRSREPDRFDWLRAHADGGAVSARIVMGDPATERQKLTGFYPVQTGGWAWTEPAFSVALAAPKPMLRATLFISPEMIALHHEVTVAARVNGVALAPERYREAGDRVYARELDRRALDGLLRVEFTVSPPYPAPAPDTRKLGVVVKAIGIEDR